MKTKQQMDEELFLAALVEAKARADTQHERLRRTRARADLAELDLQRARSGVPRERR